MLNKILGLIGIKSLYLKEYNQTKFQALNSGGTTFVLSVSEEWFWGIIRNSKQINYTVNDSQNMKNQKKHWNKLIKNRQKILISN